MSEQTLGEDEKELTVAEPIVSKKAVEEALYALDHVRKVEGHRNVEDHWLHDKVSMADLSRLAFLKLLGEDSANK